MCFGVRLNWILILSPCYLGHITVTLLSDSYLLNGDNVNLTRLKINTGNCIDAQCSAV